MKKIKIFESFLSVTSLENEVNSFLCDLFSKGILDYDIRISSEQKTTCIFIIYNEIVDE